MVPPSSHRIPRVWWYSGYCLPLRLFVYRTLTFFGSISHLIRLKLCDGFRSPNPDCIATVGLASSAFARHYSRNLVWFLFLPLLRCFSSGGSPCIPMYSVCIPWFFTMGVSSFGNLRIEAYLQLTVAYRSLSRPSSAPDAKAFTLCSYSLELPILVLVLLNCLSFLTNFVLRISFLCSKKVFSSFLLCTKRSPLGEIVSYFRMLPYFTWKDLY